MPDETKKMEWVWVPYQKLNFDERMGTGIEEAHTDEGIVLYKVLREAEVEQGT